MNGHLQGLHSNNIKCPLAKHNTQYHPMQVHNTAFKMEIIKKCRGNIEQLLMESEKIGIMGDDRLMNSKAEYGRNKLVRYQPIVDRI